MDNYWIQLKNDNRGILIQISGREAIEAKPVLDECITFGMHFEWGGMQIGTKNSEWSYRDSNTVGIGADGPIDPWLMMGEKVQNMNAPNTKHSNN